MDLERAMSLSIKLVVCTQQKGPQRRRQRQRRLSGRPQQRPQQSELQQLQLQLEEKQQQQQQRPLWPRQKLCLELVRVERDNSHRYCPRQQQK
jgi:hypothetical protein